MFGYGVRHVDLSKRELDPETHVIEHDRGRYNPPRAVSLGVHCLQGVLCVPSANGVLQQECGLGYRLCRKMPKPKRRTLWAYRGYNQYLIRRLFPEPLPENYDFSASAWVVKTHYPQWRILDLLKLVPDIPLFLNREFFRSYGICKAFIKLESYANGTVYEWGCYKPPRIISSRTDHVKVAIGPLIKAIEEQVYKLPYFIKHVPVPDRPNYIRDHVETEGCRYLSSDFTSFECGFTQKFMDACEFALYRYMLSKNPVQLQNLIAFQKASTGINCLQMGDVTCFMRARRQSGEMTTSLGNGYSNLAMTAFFLRKHLDIADMRCVVEGDDGLYAIPSNLAEKVSPRHYEKLGFMIKNSWSDTVNEASFCGLVYDDVDRINITDPIQQILNIGWSMGSENIRSTDKRLADLLAAKTYSLAYEYSGCPIVYKLARWLARANGIYISQKLIESRAWTTWYRERFIQMKNDARNIQVMLDREPSVRTRLLMERKFAIPVADQLAIERYFDGLNNIQPIDSDLILPYVCPMAVDNLKRVFTFDRAAWSTVDDFYPN